MFRFTIYKNKQIYCSAFAVLNNIFQRSAYIYLIICLKTSPEKHLHAERTAFAVLFLYTVTLLLCQIHSSSFILLYRRRNKAEKCYLRNQTLIFPYLISSYSSTILSGYSHSVPIFVFHTSSGMWLCSPVWLFTSYFAPVSPKLRLSSR